MCTRYCVVRLIIYKFSLQAVSENQLFKSDEQIVLGKELRLNCFLGNTALITQKEISVFWLKNDTVFSQSNLLHIPSINPTDNNTNYICIISIQQNPYVCPNQSKEHVVRIKCKSFLYIINIKYLSIFQLLM